MGNEIIFSSAVELSERIHKKDVSAREVMEAHLAQIEKVNPQVNAIVSMLDPDEAIEHAVGKDRALASGAEVGPMHGFPHAVKDLCDAAGFPTTQGSLLFKDNIATQDALIVERVRQAGGIVIGKTNVPEFGLGSHTYNRVFGPCHNPYDLTKSAGGSSGGAGAALASGMLPLADGSDTGGSLRNPGNFNNVVGYRVSPGLVPAWPNSKPWLGLGVKGPMARTVDDCTFFLSVLAGPDPRDQLAYPVDPARFRQPLDRDFNGVKVAWCPDLGGLPLDPRVRSTLEAQRATFEALGCTVVDVAPDLSGAEECFQILRAASMAEDERGLLNYPPGEVKPEAIWNIEYGKKLSAADFDRGMSMQQQIFERLRQFMTEYEFVLCAVNQVPPFPIEWDWPHDIDGVPMETYISWMQSAYFITVTRSPAISVPAGFTDDGLPIGLQIVGRFRDDLGVLQLAKAFETATEFWKIRPAVAI
ncbi:MAG: amidase [Thermomicrobiales bacterium]|nr:amidase [Thermomicrobiales bacterium]